MGHLCLDVHHPFTSGPVESSQRENAGIGRRSPSRDARGQKGRQMSQAKWHLSSTESEILNACEAIIQKGIQTFVEVGNALLEIRESRLYRGQYSTFEEYCRTRWAMS